MLVTSFSAKGWKEYGRRFLETYHFTGQTIPVLVYHEDNQPETPAVPGVTWRSLEEVPNFRALEAQLAASVQTGRRLGFAAQDTTVKLADARQSPQNTYLGSVQPAETHRQTDEVDAIDAQTYAPTRGVEPVEHSVRVSVNVYPSRITAELDVINVFPIGTHDEDTRALLSQKTP